MNLLPFDPFGPRFLSLLLLGLIIMLSFADSGPGSGNLVANNREYINCNGASHNRFECATGRNRIQGGSLAVGPSMN